MLKAMGFAFAQPILRIVTRSPNCLRQQAGRRRVHRSMDFYGTAPLVRAVISKPNHQEDDVKSVCKVGLLSLAMVAISLGLAHAQTGSQPDRPYSVAQAPGMPGTLCSYRSPQ